MQFTQQVFDTIHFATIGKIFLRKHSNNKTGFMGQQNIKTGFPLNTVQKLVSFYQIK
jgi:hypothetical protein